MEEFVSMLVNRLVMALLILFFIGVPLMLFLRSWLNGSFDQSSDEKDPFLPLRTNNEEWDKRERYEYMLKYGLTVRNLKRIFKEAPQDIIQKAISLILSKKEMWQLAVLIKYRPEYSEIAVAQGMALEKERGKRESNERVEALSQEREKEAKPRISKYKGLMCARCGSSNFCPDCGNCLNCNTLDDGTCYHCFAKFNGFIPDPDD